MELFIDFKLKNRQEIEGTCWIEFNISGSADKYNHHAENSKYLDENAYNLFTDIFEKYASKFNYYGPTRFTIGQLEKIKKEIEKRANDLSLLTNLEDLIEFSDKTANSINLSNELRENYDQLNCQKDKIINDIKELCKDILEFLDKCIAEKQTLWILGL
ncbi:MAG: hypothetical protein K8S18_02675 [Desulfobacula sp.]|nr:hypothetical protein [Desulfobacula sp.]